MLEVLRSRLTPAFFREAVGEPEVASVALEPLAQNSGYANDLFEVITSDKDGVSRSRVVKTMTDDKVARSKQLGLAREGLFFAQYGKELAGLGSFLPAVSFAEGDMESGKKLVIMEKLGGVQTGLLLTRHHPSTSSTSDAEMAQIRDKCGGISELEVVEAAFRIAAQVHGKFWMDQTLLDKDWLRGAEIVRPCRADAAVGQPESKAWRGAMDWAVNAWQTVKTDVLGKAEAAVKIEPRLAKCVEAVLANIDYHTYRTLFCDPTVSTFYPWSLVHGDFWPGNFVYCTDREVDRLRLLDFEMIGCGSGAQDLGQYLWSNSTPEFRRQHEAHLVREVYYQELLRSLPKDAITPSADQVFEEYKLGGFGRSIWFLCILVPMMPPAMGQYFCDQTLALMDDHFPEGADLSRVLPRF